VEVLSLHRERTGGCGTPPSGGGQHVDRAYGQAPVRSRSARQGVLPGLLGDQDSVLDREIVTLDAHGAPSFSLLQQRMLLCTFVIFDV
jgi:hypothetical protein